MMPIRHAIILSSALTACAPRRLPPDPPTALVNPTAAQRIHDVNDPVEAKRVLDGAFAKYLTGPCPEIPEAAQANTWTELDELQADAHRRGLFRPTVRQRVDGSFTAPGAEETLYVVQLEECVRNGWDGYEDVIYRRNAKEPIARVPHGNWGRGGINSVAPLPFRVQSVERADGVDKLVAGHGDGSLVFRLERDANGALRWNAMNEK